MASCYATSTQKARPFELVIAAPAGALSASGADMGKFMIAHLGDGGVLLKPETARMMHDFHAPGVGPLNSMALGRSEEHTSELQSLMRTSSAVFCLKKKTKIHQ